MNGLIVAVVAASDSSVRASSLMNRTQCVPGWVNGVEAERHEERDGRARDEVGFSHLT